MRYTHCKKSVSRALSIVALAWVTYACARIIAPEGGPKDTTPPKLVKTYPLQESTEFQGQVIKLIFDKEIEVNDLYNRLIVTPNLAHSGGQFNYTYTVYKKTLTLQLKAPLAKNTTYTFDFVDAIKDTTEGNVAVNQRLSFSTGAHLDTMYVTGQVKHLMTHQPSPKAHLELYNVEESPIHPLQRTPTYLVQADEDGRFRITHVKPGRYYIYAHKRQPNAGRNTHITHGFLKEPIDLTTTPAKSITLFVCESDIRPFKLQHQQPHGAYFELRFSKPVTHYTLTRLHTPTNQAQHSIIYSQLLDDQRVIRVYNTFRSLAENNLEAHLIANDASGSTIEEIIPIHFSTKTALSEPASYVFSPTTNHTINPNFVGTMTVNKPVQKAITARMYFIISNGVRVDIEDTDLHFNTQRNVVTIKKVLQPNNQDERVYLHMDEGAFLTVEDDPSKAVSYAYTFKNPQEYGTIQGTVTTKAPGFIVQLLDETYKVIDAIHNEHNYQFYAVAPGRYSVRLLVLQDNATRWRCGNIYDFKEPDPVVVYPEKVSVIANWAITGIDFEF